MDTDILVDVARGDVSAASSLKALAHTYLVSISAVTEMELIVGCRNKSELHELEKLLDFFQIITLTSHISDLAVSLLRQYRLSHGPLIPDALIAATALAQNSALITETNATFALLRD